MAPTSASPAGVADADNLTATPTKAAVAADAAEIEIDGDAAGDLQAAEPAAAAPLTASAKKAAKKAKVCEDKACAEASVLVVVCFVCEKGDDEGQGQGAGLKVIEGRSFHHHCHNGVRCLRNMVKNDDAAKTTVNLLITENPAEWRKLVIPLVVQPGCPRSESNRTSVKTRVEKLSAFRVIQRRRGRLLLTKRRYKAYYKFWEGMDSDEASDNFDQDIENGVYTEENEAGDTVVAVVDSTCLEDVSGRRREDTLSEKREMDGNNFQSARKRLSVGGGEELAVMGGSQAFREGRGSMRAGSAVPLKGDALLKQIRKAGGKARKVPRLAPSLRLPSSAASKASMAMSGTNSDNDDDDDDAASVANSTRSSLARKSSVKAQLKVASLAGFQALEDDARQGPQAQQEPQPQPPQPPQQKAEGAVGGDRAQKLTSVQLLAKKTELKKKVSGMTSEMSMQKSGLKAKFEIAVARLTEDEHGQMEHSVAEVLDKLSEMMQLLGEAKLEMDKATKDNVGEKEEECMTLADQFADVKEFVEEQIAAADYIDTERKANKRKQQLSCRYHLTKATCCKGFTPPSMVRQCFQIVRKSRKPRI